MGPLFSCRNTFGLKSITGQDVKIKPNELFTTSDQRWSLFLMLQTVIRILPWDVIFSLSNTSDTERHYLSIYLSIHVFFLLGGPSFNVTITDTKNMTILTFILMVPINVISLTQSVNTNHDPKLTPKLTSTLIVLSMWTECAIAHIHAHTHAHFPKLLLLQNKILILSSSNKFEGKVKGQKRTGLCF